MVKYRSIHCDNCGGPLDVPDSARLVTCQHCGSGLTVHREETVVYTATIQQLSRQTSEVRDTVKRLHCRLDTERLDRVWEVERHRLMHTPPKDPLGTPGRAGYIAAAPVFGVLTWMGMATLGQHGDRSLVLIFCVLFSLMAVALVLVTGSMQHEDYCRALESHKRRRAGISRITERQESARTPHADALQAEIQQRPGDRSTAGQMLTGSLSR